MSNDIQSKRVTRLVAITAAMVRASNALYDMQKDDLDFFDQLEGDKLLHTLTRTYDDAKELLEYITNTAA